MRIEMSGCNGHSHDFYYGNAKAIVYTDTPESQVRLAEVSGFDFPSECPFRRRLPDGSELPLKTFLCNPNIPQQ